jgi:signal transduction histidine kinase
MHGGGIRRIRVWFQESEEGGSLFIADDGRGVPEDKKERIFDRGYGDNSGYGLFLVRSILDITGITIKEVGVPGQGACFRMDLPRKIYAFKNDRGEQK